MINKNSSRLNSYLQDIFNLPITSGGEELQRKGKLKMNKLEDIEKWYDTARMEKILVSIEA
jgi:hypothetical protein